MDVNPNARRFRRSIGLLAVIILALIALDASGIQLSVPAIGGGSGQTQTAFNGVKAVAASTVVRVGSSAPAGGELAFMAVEPSGNLVVTDSQRASVMRFDPTGHLLTEWGPQLGTLQLNEPAGVAVFGDSYYVMDRGTPRIFRLDTNGQPQAMLDLESLNTYGLNGLAVDPSGNIYAADTGRNRILVFSPSGQLIKQIGHAGSDLGGFTQPMMVAFAPDASFFVADWENNRVEHFDATFEATDAWSIGFHAFGIAVDQAGRVYAPDFDHRRVEIYSPRGDVLGEIGAPTSPIVNVSPKQVAMAPGQPSLYVLGSDAIQRIDLADTPPPPQSGPANTDLISLVATLLIVVLVVLAVIARRQRRSLHPAAHRPVRLHAENGAQRQHEEAERDQDLLIANQAKREE
jgi:DNA-binding beta-propeller fold protein YncE